MKEIFWITIDGQHLPITQMTDSHLDNALAHLERSAIKNKEYWIDYYNRKIQGEIKLWRDIADDDRMAGRSYISAYEYPSGDTEEIKKYRALLILVENGDPQGIDIYPHLVAERKRRHKDLQRV